MCEYKGKLLDRAQKYLQRAGVGSGVTSLHVIKLAKLRNLPAMLERISSCATSPEMAPACDCFSMLKTCASVKHKVRHPHKTWSRKPRRAFPIVCNCSEWCLIGSWVCRSVVGMLETCEMQHRIIWFQLETIWRHQMSKFSITRNWLVGDGSHSQCIHHHRRTIRSAPLGDKRKLLGPTFVWLSVLGPNRF